MQVGYQEIETVIVQTMNYLTLVLNVNQSAASITE